MSFLTRRGEGPSFRYAGQLQVTGARPSRSARPVTRYAT